MDKLNKQRQTIAEFLGTIKWAYLCGEMIISCEVPYYDTLDEINRVESRLTDKQFEVYWWILWGMCKRNTVAEWKRAHFSADADLKREALVAMIKEKI